MLCMFLSPQDLERLLTNCSSFIFCGGEGFLTHISPDRLANLNLSGMPPKYIPISVFPVTHKELASLSCVKCKMPTRRVLVLVF